ncbi:hypothetical protein TNCV_814751 [Trichonephila clavipes]|nr:hypothetical protein TNCV_814751 [Trichonephila clavipes]
MASWTNFYDFSQVWKRYGEAIGQEYLSDILEGMKLSQKPTLMEEKLSICFALERKKKVLWKKISIHTRRRCKGSTITKIVDVADPS